MSASYKSVNYDGAIPKDLGGAFQMTCHPNTDLWEKPPLTHSFNSPIIYQVLSKKAFRSARITVTAEWKHLYDQGGLAILVHNKDAARQWIKTGIEYFNEEPNISTVGKDRWSDWSLRPIEKDGKSATVEIEDVKGTLWVWLISENGKKLPLREIAWWGDILEDAELWVGAYAAKPAKESEDLVVSFSHFSVTTV